MSADMKDISLPVRKVMLAELIKYDPVVTSTAAVVAGTLLDEVRAPDGIVSIGRDELGCRINNGRTKITEATGILEGRGWAHIRRRKHERSDYAFPLLKDPEMLKARYGAMIEDVRKSGRAGNRDVRKSEHLAVSPDTDAVRKSGHDAVRKSGSTWPDFRSEDLPGPGYTPPASDAAHRLLKRLALIAGLGSHTVTWPQAWRRGQVVTQGWLSEGRAAGLCERVAINVMRARCKARQTSMWMPPDSPMFFEEAIKRELTRKVALQSAVAAPAMPTPPAKVTSTSTTLGLYLRGRTWWGRVQVDGKEYRKSLRTSDLNIARQRFEAWRDEMRTEAYRRRRGAS